MLDIKKFHNKMLGHDVEAVKFDGKDDSLNEILLWIHQNNGHANPYYTDEAGPDILLHTLGGWHQVTAGDWLVRSETEGFSGESQSIIDVIFEEVVEKSTQPNAWIALAARICHEANRAIQLNTGDPNPSPKWDKAPEWQKNSAVEGVIKAIQGATPEELHESWVESKITDGWTYGYEKDAELKYHPCLVPYSELPPEQKLKDFVFSEIVQAFKDAVVL